MAKTSNFQPRTFVRDTGDGQRERTAHTPADVVALEFAGWTEKQTRAATPAGEAKPAEQAKK